MNNSSIICIIIAVVVAAPFAHAQTSQDKNDDFKPEPIITKIIEDSVAGTRISDLCWLEGTRNFRASRLVILMGESTCETKYGERKSRFYEVAISGKRYFIENVSLSLTETQRETLEKFPTERSADFIDRALYVSNVARLRELENLIEAIKSTKKAGLTIVHASIADMSEHSEGTGFSIKVSNPTDKTIKYIWFTVVGYNAVNDPVRDRLKGGPALTVKGIGPIEKNKSAFYEWDYMWNTDIVESFKISEIKVQYMDGSTKLIRNWKYVTLTSQQRRVLEEED